MPRYSDERREGVLAKLTGWEVEARESLELAARVLQQALLKE